MTAPAVVLRARGEPPRIEQVRVDAPGPGEVRVQIIASGLCHTDLAAVRDARVTPVLLGHEGAGVVESVGAGVDSVQPGDHVVINWQPRCGTCRACTSGRGPFCTGVRGTRQPRVHLAGAPLAVMLQAGTFCPLVVVPATGAVRVRPDLPLERAALLGCAVATGVGAALYSADVRPGDTVVVIGVGAVGLNVVQGCRLRGAGRVIAIDSEPARLAIAATFGASEGIDAGATDLVDQVLRHTAGAGADHAFEAVGTTATMNLALRVLGRGGTLTLVGAAARDVEFSLAPRAFLSNQQRLHGCIYGDIEPARDLPLFADWYLGGSLELDALHGQTISLDEVPLMFSGARAPIGVRTLVRMGACP